MRRYRTLLLLLLLLHACILHVSFASTIECIAEKAIGNGADEIYNYDCSNQNLTWSIINETVFVRMYTSRKINLSKNKLDSVIRNFTFA